jgi:hypothetical protein
LLTDVENRDVLAENLKIGEIFASTSIEERWTGLEYKLLDLSALSDSVLNNDTMLECGWTKGGRSSNFRT